MAGQVLAPRGCAQGTGGRYRADGAFRQMQDQDDRAEQFFKLAKVLLHQWVLFMGDVHRVQLRAPLHKDVLRRIVKAEVWQLHKVVIRRCTGLGWISKRAPITEPMQTISAAAICAGEHGMRWASSSTQPGSVAGIHFFALRAGAGGRAVFISHGAGHVSNWPVAPVSPAQAATELIAVVSSASSSSAEAKRS